MHRGQTSSYLSRDFQRQLYLELAGGENDSALAGQGYRWVTVGEPYACTTEQDHNDVTELHMVESIRCYYLVPAENAP